MYILSMCNISSMSLYLILKISIHIEWSVECRLSLQAYSTETFSCAIFSFGPQSHWITFPYLLFFFCICLVRILYRTLPFIIKLIATNVSALFYLILLDLSLSFTLLLIFEQRKNIPNEKSPFIQWLTLTSEIKGCNESLHSLLYWFCTTQKHCITTED